MSLKNIKLIKEIAILKGQEINDKDAQDIYEKVSCEYIDGILNKSSNKKENKNE